MDIMNKAPQNNDYEGLNENSTDLERLDAFFAVLMKTSQYGEYVDAWQLKIKLSEQAHFEALLLDTGFVTDESGYNEQPSFKLKSKALLLLKQFGSYSAYKEAEKAHLKNENEKSEEKENLEMQKLRGEVNNLTNRLLDYDKQKRRTSRSEIISIIAVILTAIGLIIQWIIYKSS